MKKLIFSSIIFAMSLSVSAQENIEGLYCGTRGNLWGTIASELVIPDYFPPEHWLLRLVFANPLLIDLSICEEDFEPVNLGQSCMVHDQCYGTLGETKDECDTGLLNGWLNLCQERYGNTTATTGPYCKSMCDIAADLMYNAMRYDDGTFCPSCEAFERSQDKARRGISRE